MINDITQRYYGCTRYLGWNNREASYRQFVYAYKLTGNAVFDNDLNGKLFINRLPLECCKAFLLYADGYKYQEIADAMNISIGTVKSDIYTACAKLKHTLRGYVGWYFINFVFSVCTRSCIQIIGVGNDSYAGEEIVLDSDVYCCLYGCQCL